MAGGTAGSAAGGPKLTGAGGQSSNFRNVSACNRCRLRKNRCDQMLPSCASCAKAGVACVGYDPITKTEIPRSYVFYLETRVRQLESILIQHELDFPPAEDLDLSSRVTPASTFPKHQRVATPQHIKVEDATDYSLPKPSSQPAGSMQSRDDNTSPTMTDPPHSLKSKALASTSGISFARVVLAAVQHSSTHQKGSSGENAAGQMGVRSSGTTSMRDSFFGLHTKPTIQPAPFPDRETASRLVTLYFEHANPQIPILHRPEFMTMLDRALAKPDSDLGPREEYVLNMVFAIGSGVIVGESGKTGPAEDAEMEQLSSTPSAQPEEYHASAIVHLEACLSSSEGGLEVLQAVLLLASFALLRPVPPGLWYIVGVAMRLAVDLGLHHEDGGELADPAPTAPHARGVQSADEPLAAGPSSVQFQERARRLWTRDMRRRLWWCTYSFDRLVGMCVGRPFGISDQVITTGLPSILDDEYIRRQGVQGLDCGERLPSYKYVAHHYFRLRLLQSEIMEVLQYNQAQIARVSGQGSSYHYPEMQHHLPCAFLAQHDSFRAWRMDIDRRLYQWRETAPTQRETGVDFRTEFLELNYWQAIILLYRQSLSVPTMFEGEYNTSDEINSPAAHIAELREDQESIYLKVAEAGQRILRLYRQLHLGGMVSYTYLSTHHLFTAGISYLYAIWHSPGVRSCLTMDEVDFTILAAKSVFTDLMDRCPPAETCRDAFDRTAKATMRMAASREGFGASALAQQPTPHSTMNYFPTPDATTTTTSRPSHPRQHHNASDLSIANRMASSPSLSVTSGGSQPSPADNVDRGTPMMQQRILSANSFPAQQHHHNNKSTGPEGTPIDPSLVSSSSSSTANTARNILNAPAPGAAGAITSPSSSSYFAPAVAVQHKPPRQTTAMPQQRSQYGLGSPADYGDMQGMDFLQGVQMAPPPPPPPVPSGTSTMSGGDSSSHLDGAGGYALADQGQLDLAFGFNWDGLQNEFGEAQQMNPFDTFFFGGPQQQQ